MANEFNLKDYLTISKILHHFAIGFLSSWLGASLLPVLGFHFGWEVYTNSAFGKQLNKKIFGQDFADRFWQESVMDNLLFVAGWVTAYILSTNQMIPANPLINLGQQ